MPPPPIPQSKPPPLPGRHRTGLTIVYAVFSVVFVVVSAIWTYERGMVSGHGRPGFAIGMVQGGVLFPLGLAVGIACFWKRNRNVHAIVRVLFWASAFLVFIKVSQVVGHRG